MTKHSKDKERKDKNKDQSKKKKQKEHTNHKKHNNSKTVSIKKSSTNTNQSEPLFLIEQNNIIINHETHVSDSENTLLEASQISKKIKSINKKKRKSIVSPFVYSYHSEFYIRV